MKGLNSEGYAEQESRLETGGGGSKCGEIIGSEEVVPDDLLRRKHQEMLTIINYKLDSRRFEIFT